MRSSVRRRLWAALWLCCWVPLSITAAAREAGPTAPLWYGVDAHGEPLIYLHFFWTESCPHCREARPYVEMLKSKYPWLRVRSYDLTGNRGNLRRYEEMAASLGESARSVPAFLYCEAMVTGYAAAESSGRRLEQHLLKCYQRLRGEGTAEGPDAGVVVEVPFFGEVDTPGYSLPLLTLLIAGVDAFNPCAFFVPLFLLSLLLHGRSRARIATIGGIFVLFSAAMYFVFMAAWLNVFLLMGRLSTVTFVAGLIAVGMGAVNIKDFFFFGRGPTLSIPEEAKPKLFQRMRSLVASGRWPAMLAGTVILAFAANSYELLCTAGFPMLYTRILTLNDLAGVEYYLYLAFYNLIYVIPLLVIVIIFTVTMGSKKLSEAQGRALKLMSGLMMLGLGGVLLFAPDLLTRLASAILLVVASAALTLILAFTYKPQTS